MPTDILYIKFGLTVFVRGLILILLFPISSYAQPDEIEPIPFFEPIELSRGTLSPYNPESTFLSEEDACVVFKEHWGWNSCEGYEAFVIAPTQETDNMLVEAPNSDGYVKFDDWKSVDRDDQIEGIENSIVESVKQQSEELGYEVRFIGWRVYPTLDEEKKILYYATDISFDGKVTTNVTASLFDRRGYVTFDIIPDASMLDAEEIRRIVIDNIALYKPKNTELYSAFSSGDVVAAVGILGVLAALVGVKDSKAATTGIFAGILLLLKKFIYVLILPFLWVLAKVKSIFGRKD